MATTKHHFSKLPNQGKTIFAIMSELANQYNAIDLSRGFPDFMADPVLINLYCEHLRKGNNQYAPVYGIMPLREKISEKVESDYGAIYNPENEISITAGATEAIFNTITTFIKEGDEVIIFEPAYDLYTPVVKINGGIPIYVELKLPGYSFNWDAVHKAITANTRMIIVNNPHNPTGNVFSAWDMECLKKLVNGTEILILSDEVYEHIVFDGIIHESVLAYKDLRERSIIVSSFGKMFHVTGWRLGYIIAPKKIMSEFRKIHQYSTYTANTPAQFAICDYMQNNHKLNELNSFFQAKRDLFVESISGSRFEIIPTKGSYFLNLKYSNISDEGDFEFASRLIRESRIASIPLSYFYKDRTDNKVLRFCFAKEDETIKKGAEILQGIK